MQFPSPHVSPSPKSKHSFFSFLQSQLLRIMLLAPLQSLTSNKLQTVTILWGYKKYFVFTWGSETIHGIGQRWVTELHKGVNLFLVHFASLLRQELWVTFEPNQYVTSQYHFLYAVRTLAFLALLFSFLLHVHKWQKKEDNSALKKKKKQRCRLR